MMVGHCFRLIKRLNILEDGWSYFDIMGPHGLMYFWQTFLSSVLALMHVDDPCYQRVHALEVLALRGIGRR
jgi:hypothetical protein